MITQETILTNVEHGVPSGNYDGSSQDWYSDAVQAAAYFRGRGSLQTLIISVAEFQGKITVEATLDTLADTATWFDTYEYDSTGSPSSDYHPENITGNFVWIRLRVEDFSAGTITAVTVGF